MTLEEAIEKKTKLVEYWTNKVELETKIGHSISLPEDKRMLESETQVLNWFLELQRLRATPEDLECEHCRYFQNSETEYPCNQCCRLNSEVDYYEPEQN